MYVICDAVCQAVDVLPLWAAGSFPVLCYQRSLSAFHWPIQTNPSLTFSEADFYLPQVCSHVAAGPGCDLSNQVGGEGRMCMLPSNLHTVNPRFYYPWRDFSLTGLRKVE